jgi:hypothetical protein
VQSGAGTGLYSALGYLFKHLDSFLRGRQKNARVPCGGSLSLRLCRSLWIRSNVCSDAQLAIAHEKREGIGALQFAGLQQASKQTNETMPVSNGMFGYVLLKFNSHHINVFSNAWSTKCKLIVCMSVQIRSNLRDKSIKPN